MLLPINFRETTIAFQSNQNIRAIVSSVEEELHTAHKASGFTRKTLSVGETSGAVNGIEFSENSMRIVHQAKGNS